MDTPRKHLKFINIVPIFPDDPDFAVSEIRRQRREVGLTRFALMLSLHPEGTPARARLFKLFASAKQVMAALKDEPVQVGILIQSTLGHGWSGPLPLTDEPWQRIERLDGAVLERRCPTDPAFRKYILDAVAGVMELNPAFLLMDDDFGLRLSECVCPNHVRLFNEATGKNFTRDELTKLLTQAPVDDPLARVFSRQRDELITKFAQEVRAVIDQYNPEIQCTMCTPCGGHSVINAVTHALAGKATPSARVNNAIYGTNYPIYFTHQCSGTNMVRFQFEDVPELLDEADTFPQNYFSETAAMFHTHLTNAILNGLSGAKLWMSEYKQPVNTGSQAKYEEIFRTNSGFYEELYNTVSNMKWCGVRHVLTHPADINHPVNGSLILGEPDWLLNVMMPFAIPVAYDDGTSEGIFALTAPVVKRLSDEELKRLFTRKLLIDSVAAKELTMRGFAELMGVKTAEDAKFDFRGEWREDMATPLSLMWEARAAKLECVSDQTGVMTWCTMGETCSRQFEKVSPCMTAFKNALGGRVVVVAWSYAMDYYKIFSPRRRAFVLDALKYLNQGALDMVLDAEQQVIIRHGKLDDKTDVAVLIAVTVDPLPAIRLTFAAKPVEVTLLAPDGAWKPVPFTHEAGILEVKTPLNVCQPVALKIRQ